MKQIFLLGIFISFFCQNSFACETCRDLYRYCNGKIYHLSNDYYYFSTDPDCEKDAQETLGSIKAYQDILDVLKQKQNNKSCHAKLR